MNEKRREVRRLRDWCGVFVRHSKGGSEKRQMRRRATDCAPNRHGKEVCADRMEVLND